MITSRFRRGQVLCRVFFGVIIGSILIVIGFLVKPWVIGLDLNEDDVREYKNEVEAIASRTEDGEGVDRSKKFDLLLRSYVSSVLIEHFTQFNLCNDSSSINNMNKSYLFDLSMDDDSKEMCELLELGIVWTYQLGISDELPNLLPVKNWAWSLLTRAAVSRSEGSGVLIDETVTCMLNAGKSLYHTPSYVSIVIAEWILDLTFRVMLFRGQETDEQTLRKWILSIRDLPNGKDGFIDALKYESYIVIRHLEECSENGFKLKEPCEVNWMLSIFGRERYFTRERDVALFLTLEDIDNINSERWLSAKPDAKRIRELGIRSFEMEYGRPNNQHVYRIVENGKARREATVSYLLSIADKTPLAKSMKYDDANVIKVSNSSICVENK